jgi:hypothetical protein
MRMYHGFARRTVSADYFNVPSPRMTRDAPAADAPARQRSTDQQQQNRNQPRRQVGSEHGDGRDQMGQRLDQPAIAARA